MYHHSASLYLLFLAFSPLLTTASLHHFFTGNFQGTARLHAFEFNDETATLTLTNNFQAHGAHSWLSVDHHRKNLFGVYLDGSNISSYTIIDDHTIHYNHDVTVGPECARGPNVHMTQSTREPYCVYAAVMARNCGAVFSTEPLAKSSNTPGALSSSLQTFSYDSSSGIHGNTLTPDQSFLFSADLSGNAIWGHHVATNGSCLVSGPAFRLAAHKEGAGPRHLVVHPNGQWLYVLLELSNELAVYSLATGYESPELIEVHSLIPDNTTNPSRYWSAEVNFSKSARYLYASSRGRTGSGLNGYINGFKLAKDGLIQRRMFMEPTTYPAGFLVQIQPAPWSDEWIAVADHMSVNPRWGYTQIWKFDESSETIELKANVEVNDGGCCANIAWLD